MIDLMGAVLLLATGAVAGWSLSERRRVAAARHLEAMCAERINRLVRTRDVLRTGAATQAQVEALWLMEPEPDGHEAEEVR